MATRRVKPDKDIELSLDAVETGLRFLVNTVIAPADAPEWRQWLEEVGFLRGEHVAVLARGVPGGDPLVIRVGLSTFALRRAEAACVRVIPVKAGDLADAGAPA